MCGLVGLFSNLLTTSEKTALSQLLYMDTLRGWDSTGVAAVDAKSGDSMVYKRAVPGADFIYYPQYDKIVTACVGNPCILIGHNRFATKGRVSSATAHPFEHDGVILAHNGTLLRHNKLGGGNNFQVDSEAVCWAISKANDAKDVIEELDGAFALTWYDREEGSMNFCRNEDRPLWMATLLDHNNTVKGMIWASEPWMLRAVISRVKGLNVGKELVPLAKGVILSYDTANAFNLSRSEEVSLYEPKKFTVVQTPRGTHGSGDTKGTTKAQQSGSQTSGQGKSGTSTRSTEQSQSQSNGGSTGSAGEIGNTLPKVWSPEDPDLGEYIDFEIHTDDFSPYGGSETQGFCLGFAYGNHVAYTVRAGAFEPGVHKSGVYRGRITSTSIAEHSAVIGDSNRILYVTMYNSVYIGPAEDVEQEEFIKGSERSRDPSIDYVDTGTEEDGDKLPVLYSDVYSPYTLSGPFKEAITEEEFDELTKHGCAICSCNLCAAEHLGILWVDSRTPVCSTCQLDDTYYAIQ